MVHYNFLKLKDGTDVDEVFCRCQDVYARLEEELDFLHSARVCRCATVRDSNADIMMVMELDAPEPPAGLFAAPHACRPGSGHEGAESPPACPLTRNSAQRKEG